MLIVVGSRRDGCSLKLAREIEEKLTEERIHAELIVPGNQRIHLCTGCMDCDKSGVCDFSDDMAKNIELIKNEKVILFITPTRWNLLSGDLKIFMDRLNPLYSTRSLKGKVGIAISIGAQPKDVYSAYEATASLRSFMESAGMDCPFSAEINDCKETLDLSRHRDEIATIIAHIKKIAKEN